MGRPYGFGCGWRRAMALVERGVGSDAGAPAMGLAFGNGQ